MNPMKPLLDKLAFFLIFSTFLTAVILYFHFTVDDAYIVLRYVRNLAWHQELSFNVDERVNALTSPFHALFIWPLFTFFPLSALSLYKLLALLLLLAGTFLLVKIYAFKRAVIFLSLVLLLLSPFVLQWTLGGLETPLLFFTLTAMVFYARDRERAGKNLFRLALLSGIAFIIRFDSVLFTGPLLLTLYATSRPLNFRAIWMSFSIALILPLCWLAFAYLFYHDLFPTSFYVKGRASFSRLVYGDIFYTLQFLLLSGCIPLLGLLLVLYRKKIAYSPWFKQNLHFLPGLLLIGVYFVFNGTVHMMFGYRLIIPYFPVLLKLIFDFIPRQPESRTTKALYPAVAFFFIFQCVHLWYVFAFSVQGFNLVQKAEYRSLSLQSYKTSFIPTLEGNALDLQKHISANPKFSGNLQPKLFTFAEGVVPYHMEEMYVFGELISYRHSDESLEGLDLERHIRRGADYIHVLHPRKGLGSIPFQLGREQLPEHYRIISNREFFFDGKLRRSIVYYNPSPPLVTLSKYSFPQERESQFLKASGEEKDRETSRPDNF